MNKKGILFIVSGPSGVGKGTVLKEVFKMRADLHFSISATTRAPREGEENGVHYHFMSREEFAHIRENGGFFENAEFCGNCYGTLNSEVFDYLEKGINVILEIEVQGALQIKKKYPEGVFLYVAPPSLKVLEERLKGRKTEDDETIKKRLDTAKWEITNIGEYDYIVVNDDISVAACEINSIINAEHTKVSHSLEYIKENLV